MTTPDPLTEEDVYAALADFDAGTDAEWERANDETRGLIIDQRDRYERWLWAQLA